MADDSIGGVKVTVRGDYSQLLADMQAAQQQAAQAGQRIAAAFTAGTASATASLTNLSSALNGTGKEFQLVDQYGQGIPPMLEKVGSSAKVMASSLESGRVSMEKWLSTSQQVNAANEQTAKSLGDIAASAAVAGAALSLAITAPLTLVSMAALKSSADIEMATIAFTKMLGSAEAAQGHLEQLKQFAVSTPFQFTELVEASKRMQALGFAGRDVIPTLRTVGDAVAGVGGSAQTLDRVILALGQMQAKGRVAAQEMNQLAEAGIPAWQLLADAIGVTVPQAMDMAEKKAITAADAIPAILAGMNEKFGGMMDAQSKTLAGQWSNFVDKLKLILIDLGNTLSTHAKQMLEAVQPILGVLKSLVEWFGTLSPRMQTVIIAMGAIAAAAGPALLALAGMVKTITALAEVIPLVGAAASTATPLLIAFGVAVAGWAIYEAVTQVQALNKEIARLQDQMDRGKTATAAEAEQIKLLLGIINDHNQVFGNTRIVVDATGKSVKEYIAALMEAAKQTDLYKNKQVELNETHEHGMSALEKREAYIKSLEEAEKKLTDAVKMATLEYNAAYRAYENGTGSIERVIEANRKLGEAQRALDPQKWADDVAKGNEALADSADKLVKSLDDSIKKLAEMAPHVQTVFVDGVQKLVRTSNEMWSAQTEGAQKGRDAMVEVTATIESRIPPAVQAIFKLRDAFHSLGADTPNELRTAAAAHQQALDQILADANTSSTYKLALATREAEQLYQTQRLLGNRITGAQQEQLDRMRRQLEEALHEQESMWAKWADFVVGTINDIGKALTRGFIDAFKGLFNNDFNKNLEQQSADLKKELEKRAADLAKFEEDTAKQMQEVKDKYQEKITTETQALRDGLRDREREYDEFAQEIGQRLEEVTRDNREQLARQVDDVRRALDQKERDYADFVADVNAREAEIRRANADSLAGQLDDLRANLAERQREYEYYLADSASQLQRLQQDLGSRIQDLQKQNNRSQEDENDRYSRDVQSIHQRLNEAQLAGDVETTRQLQIELAQRAQEHAKALARLQEDYQSETTELRKQTEQRTADLQEQMRRREEAENAFLEETRKREQEVTKIHAEELNKQLEDLKKQLDDRRTALDADRAETEKRIVELTQQADEDLRNQREALEKQLAERQKALDEYRLQVEQQIEELTAKYEDEQAKELAALQATLDAKRAEYAQFRADVEAELARLEAAHQSMMDRIGKMFSDLFKSVLEKLAEFVGDLLWDEVENKVKKAIFGVGADAADSGAGEVIKTATDGGLKMVTSGPASSAITGAAGAGSTVAGAATSAVSSVLTGFVAPIASAVSAISDVISNFQFAHMNTALGRIEESTRYLKIDTETMVDLANQWWPKIGGLEDFNWSFIAPQTAYIESLLEGIDHDIVTGLGALLKALGGEIPSALPALPAAPSSGASPIEEVAKSLMTPRQSTSMQSTTNNVTMNVDVKDNNDADMVMEKLKQAIGAGGQT